MKKISFIFLFFIMLSCSGFAQGVDSNQTIYTLSPLLSVKPKIYIFKESDLIKHQLPQNYMIVKNPLKDTATLWEFPNEFPAGQTQQLPTVKPPAAQSASTAQEKQKSVVDLKLPAGLDQMTKLLESLSPGSGKEFSINDLKQLLPIINKK
jgi:hypothetical protein